MNSTAKRDEQLRYNNCVKKLENRPVHGEVIGKIASSRYYVYEKTEIEKVAEVMIADESIYTIAVVDKERIIKGVIVRNKLLDLLSKPFGRDLYIKKPIIAAALQIEQFFEKKNLFTIADKLSDGVDPHKTVHYALVNESGQFSGIFSSRDMLLYLSEITRKDISMAKKLQSSIVREEYEIVTDNTRIVGCSKMAKDLGGDYYAVRKTGENEWVFILADVSGKGVSASLLSVTLGGMMSIYDFSKGLKDFILSINSYIHDSFGNDRFLTGIFARFNEISGELILYDMGHSYSYVVRNKKVQQIKAPDRNFPLGITEELTPVCIRLNLNQGDIYIAVSDGIEEQRDINDEEYGISRFLKSILNSQNEPVEKLHQMIFTDIKKFRKGQALGDDMTFVLLEKK